MIPKSTAKLVPGDFCLIPRVDGTAVAFAFLRSVPGKRSYFYGALLAPAFPSTSPLPPRLSVAARAMVHIHCFAKNSTPIVGNAARHIGSEELSAAQEACTDMSVGAIHSVWGYRTIVRRANDVEA